MTRENLENRPVPSSAGKLIILSGPSGVGKGSLVRELIRRGEFPLTLSVSATTREKRAGERAGVDYDYLTRDEFLRRRDAGEFLESFEVYPGGALYGTPADKVESAMNAGRWVILEIDVKGAMEVLKSHPDALTIFILPPNNEALRERLTKRGSESAESLAKRLAQAEAEITQSDRYRYRVVNDRFEDAVDEISRIFRSERDR